MRKQNSAVRIKNLGTAIGTTTSNDFAFEGFSKFPAGVHPYYRFMNRRSLERLRYGRTNVTSPTGVTTLPMDMGRIPHSRHGFDRRYGDIDQSENRRT